MAGTSNDHHGDARHKGNAMTDFIGAVMSGFVVLLLMVLIIYFVFTNGPFLLVIAGFVALGGIIGYLSGRHETRDE